MKKLLGFTLLIALIVVGVLIYDEYQKANEYSDIQPKATYKEYKIYDLVESRSLMCAEAVEILGVSEGYSYYLPCIKSGKIMFVSSQEKITLIVALNNKIITLEELYELKIVERQLGGF